MIEALLILVMLHQEPPLGQIDDIAEAAAEIQASQPPEAFLRHLISREDHRRNIYRDSQGNLTGGVGHKLTKEEKNRFRLGQEVSLAQRADWLRSDATKAWSAARSQAKELGQEANTDFTSSLGSVNFQLGNNWNREHKKTWGLLKAGKFKEASSEAARSRWNRQTPKRVLDFQAGIKGLIK